VEAKLGLFEFREKTNNGSTNAKKTNIIDMRGADVHITLWYNKDVTEYNSTSAVFNS
jgi:hypothetical protein